MSQNITITLFIYVSIAGAEYIKIMHNRALCDQFLTFPKTSQSSWDCSLKACLLKIQYGRRQWNWIYCGSSPIFTRTMCNSIFPCFGGKNSIYEVNFVFQGHFKDKSLFQKHLGQEIGRNLHLRRYRQMMLGCRSMCWTPFQFLHTCCPYLLRIMIRCWN